MLVSLYGDVFDMILYICMDCCFNCCGLGWWNRNLVYVFYLGIYSLELNYMNIWKYIVFRCVCGGGGEMYLKDKVFLFENYILRNV